MHLAFAHCDVVVSLRLQADRNGRALSSEDLLCTVACQRYSGIAGERELRVSDFHATRLKSKVRLAGKSMPSAAILWRVDRSGMRYWSWSKWDEERHRCFE